MLNPSVIWSSESGGPVQMYEYASEHNGQEVERRDEEHTEQRRFRHRDSVKER